MKIGRCKVVEKSSGFTHEKNSGSAGLVLAPIWPKWADRAQNSLNVVTPWIVQLYRIWSGSVALCRTYSWKIDFSNLKSKYNILVFSLQLVSIQYQYFGNLLRRWSRQLLHIGSVQERSSSVCWQIAIYSKSEHFRAMVSIDDLKEVLYRVFEEPIIRPLKYKMVETELVMGYFFKTQPNPKFLDPTHKSLHLTQPNPWHIRLYRKLYTTTVTRHRQVHSSQLEWKSEESHIQPPLQ